MGLGAVLLLAVGFFAGRVSSPQSDADASAKNDSAFSERTHRGRRLTNKEYRESPAHPSNLSKPGGMKAGMAYALDEIDPIQRTIKINEVIEHMNAENWQDVVDGMIKSNGETGRSVVYQMRSVLMRIGQVDGQLALENGVNLRSEGDSRNHILYGWAMKDPLGAWNWAKEYNANNPDRPMEIYGSAFGGMTRAFPGEATQILREMPDDEWRHAVDSYVRNIIRSETIDRTDDWLREVMESERPDQLKAVAVRSVLDRIGSAARNYRDPAKVAGWYREFGSEMDDEGRGMAIKLVKESASRDGVNAAQLITELESNGMEFDQHQLGRIRGSIKPDRRAEVHLWLMEQGQEDLASWFVE